MKLAFLTGALSAAFAAAVLMALVLWAISVFAGATGVWSWAPPVIALVAAAFGVATYVAERLVHRRMLARMRATGEPWAFREE